MVGHLKRTVSRVSVYAIGQVCQEGKGVFRLVSQFPESKRKVLSAAMEMVLTLFVFGQLVTCLVDG